MAKKRKIDPIMVAMGIILALLVIWLLKRVLFNG